MFHVRNLAPARESLLAGLFLSGVLLAVSPVAAEDPSRIEFNRDIRPILSDACFHCHGPDGAHRQADLRLDLDEEALSDRGGARLLVPGDPGASELFRRVTAEDDHERMPPSDAARPLTAEEIDLLGGWIAQGAEWQPHWSLVPPQRPALPAVGDARWPRNGIDHFVLARLERAGLAPSPEADRTTLIRRATLDLTGLPPTPEEVEAFVADDAPGAYERLVDRLLASPRFGERMAVAWLEAARYADTSGYQSDGPRDMWRWRDWVIDAYNANLPFDRFTVEQLAGDLLPSPSREQRIATGFNRNHRGNAEGGIVPEEYQVEYVVDRVDTTATVWLGLTVGCARCHDHKYDPVTQKEFYELYAYFNNVPEHGRAIKEGNSPPFIPAPTPEQEQRLHALERAVAQAEAAVARLEPRVAGAQGAWEAAAPAGDVAGEWIFADGLASRFAFHREDQDAALPAFEDGEAAFAPGRLGRAARFDGRRFAQAPDVGDFGYFDKFSLAAWVQSEGGQGTILSRMTDVERGDGYAVQLREGRIQVNLVKRWLDDAIRVETERALRDNEWQHVAVTYDGSRTAEGVAVYVDGRPEPLTVHLDFINQSFATPEPFRIGAGGGPQNRFRGLIDDVRVYDCCLTADEIEVAAAPDSIGAILEIDSDHRSPQQARKLRAYFLERHAPADLRAAHERLVALRRERDAFAESLPTVMVMEEMETPRATHVLLRGEYDKPGERVFPGVPAALPSLPDAVENNRLGLVKWLVDPSNPLTARVAVNRHWQMLFGAGLVRTVEDFGAQGEPPSHPELLDWLATEFMGAGGAGAWDVKRLLRLIVTSAAYRQASGVSPEQLQRDPENRLLGRGPRIRLSAEMVRDQALAASGLLVERLGGPSVKPYQPEGLWREVAIDGRYEQDTGPALYRRSLYTYWKRTVSPPAMVAFDASTREACTVRQTRTNTPLQALALMNDVTYVEASRRLAERIMSEAEAGSTPAERITWAFRLAATRRPKPAELDILVEGWHAHRAAWSADPAAAEALLSVGDSAPSESLNPAEQAAYATVCGLILNLDEVVTKE